MPWRRGVFGVFGAAAGAAELACAVHRVAGPAPCRFAFLIRKRTVRIRKFEEHVSRGARFAVPPFNAGHAFQTAHEMAADELRDPVGPEFKKTFDQQNFGLPLREALNAMAERIPSSTSSSS